MFQNRLGRIEEGATLHSHSLVGTLRAFIEATPAVDSEAHARGKRGRCVGWLAEGLLRAIGAIPPRAASHPSEVFFPMFTLGTIQEQVSDYRITANAIPPPHAADRLSDLWGTICKNWLLKEDGGFSSS